MTNETPRYWFGWWSHPMGCECEVADLCWYLQHHKSSDSSKGAK
jgi:hypothetical protein